MQALWINKFDFSGNTAAVIAWAEGILQTGWKIHLILNEVPPFLLPLYRKYLSEAGLQNSFNINRQQIQNLLFYSNFDLLHAFHPDLYHMSAEIGKSFQVPWVASFLSGDHPVPIILCEADLITCSNSGALQTLQQLLYPFGEKPLHLIPQGIKTSPVPDFSQPRQWGVLYAGPPKNCYNPPFLALQEVVRGLPSWRCGVFSHQKPSRFSGMFHPWIPSFGTITRDYPIVASHGYLLLEALAAGKIALLLEENYTGIFYPFSRLEQVPALKAKFPAVKTSPPENIDIRKLLRRDLQMLCTDRNAREKLQRDNWSYACENHDIGIIAEKFRCLYNRLLKIAY